jgi:putative membrane protein
MRWSLIAAWVLLTVSWAKAHDGGAIPADVWSHWNFDPLLLIGLLLPTYLYVCGAATYRVERWRTGLFAAGIATLFIALLSPLHALSHSLFSAHMIQHMLLVLVAAPLLTLSQPLPPLLRGLPSVWRKKLGSAAHIHEFKSVWQWLSRPITGLGLHVAALWLWHVPGLYSTAVNNPMIHALEHLSFFITAALYWWAIRSGYEYGGRVLSALALMMASGLLGALMTFSRTPWYGDHANTTLLWGMTPLADQQLAGVVMWIPMGMVYVITGAVVLGRWINAVDQQIVERERKLLEEVRDG